MHDFPSLAGQLLIAMPSLDDPQFENTVTLICEHNEEGAMGLTINRALDLTHGEVFEQVDGFTELDDSARNLALLDQPVLQGGPVSLERGFVLHSERGNFEATLDVADGIYVTLSRDVLDALVTEHAPANGTMALGYAGWDADQLEDEIKANAWLTTPATPAIVFEAPLESRWDRATRAIGVTREQLTGPAGHA